MLENEVFPTKHGILAPKLTFCREPCGPVASLHICASVERIAGTAIL
jgi:hypothetical protein